MKNVITILIFVAISTYDILLFAQQKTGAIKGKVTDEQGNALPFVNIISKKGEKIMLALGSDIDGNFILKPLLPDSYNIEASFIGLEKTVINGVIVKADKITSLNITMKSGAEQLKCVEIVASPILLEKDEVTMSMSVIREDIKAMPAREVIKTVGGIYSADDGSGILNARGCRPDANYYYIDGVKVRGSSNLTKNLSEQESKIVEMVIGGTVVNYGEANTEEYEKISENSYTLVKNEALSTFSIDVDRASYGNVRRFIENGQKPPTDAVRIEEMINYFEYNYSQPTGNDKFAIQSTLTSCPWAPDHQLLMLGLQGKTVETEHLPASNLVFLIDVSGSMESYNKLPLVKKSLEMLIQNLRDKDRVSIVVYAGAAGLVLPSTKGNKKLEIIDAIQNLQAGGSTAGGEGIQLAYKIAEDNFIEGGNNRIILATDGDFNVGISNNNELETFIETKRKSGVFLTCLGFGMGNYKDSKLELLADKGNGNYSYIDNLQEAEKELVTEFAGTLFTIAKDVKIQIEFNPQFVQSYRLIGYENRMLNKEDFTDDTKDAGEIGSGHTVTAFYEIVPVGVKLPEKKDEIVLKYQSNTVNTSLSNYSELATIKCRYKELEDTTSKEISKAILNKAENMDLVSEDVRFASSVIMFGMLLKNSMYKKDIEYKDVLELAQSSKGQDENGYRAEFIKLVKLAKAYKM